MLEGGKSLVGNRILGLIHATDRRPGRLFLDSQQPCGQMIGRFLRCVCVSHLSRKRDHLCQVYEDVVVIAELVITLIALRSYLMINPTVLRTTNPNV